MFGIRGGRGGGTGGQRAGAGPSRAHSSMNIKQEGVGDMLDAEAEFGCGSGGPVDFPGRINRGIPQPGRSQGFHALDADLAFGCALGAETEVAGGSDRETQQRGPVRDVRVARGSMVSVRGKQIIQSIAQANVDHQRPQNFDPKATQGKIVKTDPVPAAFPGVFSPSSIQNGACAAAETPAREDAPGGTSGRGGIAGRGARGRGGATPKRSAYAQPATLPTVFSSALDVELDASVGVTEARTNLPNIGNRNASNGGASRRGGGGRGGAVPICRNKVASAKKADEPAVANTAARPGGSTFAPVAPLRELWSLETTNTSPPVAKKPRHRSVSGRYVENDVNVLYAKHLCGRDTGGAPQKNARTVDEQAAAKDHAGSSMGADAAYASPLQSSTASTEHTGPALAHRNDGENQAQSTRDQHAASSHVSADHGTSAKSTDSDLAVTNDVARASHEHAAIIEQTDEDSGRPGLILSALNVLALGEDATRSALHSRPADRKHSFDKPADLGYERLPVVEYTDVKVQDAAAETEDKGIQVSEPANPPRANAFFHQFGWLLLALVVYAVGVILSVSVSVDSSMHDKYPR